MLDALSIHVHDVQFLPAFYHDLVWVPSNHCEMPSSPEPETDSCVITELPLEILRLICFSQDPAGDEPILTLSDVSCFSQTSRHFQSYIEPVLWERVIKEQHYPALESAARNPDHRRTSHFATYLIPNFQFVDLRTCYVLAEGRDWDYLNLLMLEMKNEVVLSFGNMLVAVVLRDWHEGVLKMLELVIGEADWGVNVLIALQYAVCMQNVDICRTLFDFADAFEPKE